MQYKERQLAPEELHFWTCYLHTLFLSVSTNYSTFPIGVPSLAPVAMTYICHSLHAPHSVCFVTLNKDNSRKTCLYSVSTKGIPLISSNGWLQSWTFTGAAYLYGFVHSVLQLPVSWISESILMPSAWQVIKCRPITPEWTWSQSAFIFILKQIDMPAWSKSITLCLWCYCCSWYNMFLITYPGVSGLLKFLCNGLIRGHDNKHLDGHVEDGHGDQVGNIVSMEKNVNRGSV